MKSRYRYVVCVGVILAALTAGLHVLDRIGGSVIQNAATQPTSALPVSDSNLSDIRSMLEKQEYHISYDERMNMLQSPNRAHNLRAYYQPGKLTVQTRVDTKGRGFKLQLVNEGVFADGKLLHKPETHAKTAHHENKVQIAHEAFTEEFINNEDGVRQNFIIENAPAGTRQLQIRMMAKGLEVEQGSANELRFYSKAADGQTRNELVYSDLQCWDANKQPLNATLAYVDNRIRISVDVANAAYPVTIDPIIANGTPQNANKVLEINQSYMWLGFSVSSAGDVNGDGYSDVIAGAPHYDLGQDNEGAAFVYKGGPSGLTLTAVTLECNQKDAEMGYSVSSAGDFNGDGFSDVLVGIPYYDGAQTNQGAAKLYLGSGTFFAPQAVITSYTYTKNVNPEALTGIAVATAGDVDGDGYSDVLIGAHQDSNGQIKEGTVALCHGSANGDLNTKLVTLEANQPNAHFGYSVAGAGDVDGDGFGDVIVGARFYASDPSQAGEGAAFVYRGTASGLDTNNPAVIEGNQLNAAMGNKVSSAGDVNGDGYSDILISAYLYDEHQEGITYEDGGAVFLHLGSATGIQAFSYKISKSYQTNAQLGSSIACAGDVNGDGYSDILIGAQYYDNGQFNEGAVFVYYGFKYGVGYNPVSTLESNQIDGWFGTAVASAGDVNGDGYSDILVGCYTFDNGQKDEGHVFVYHGGPKGIGTEDAAVLSGTVPGAGMGYSVASAGDVNSDGFDDVIVGAPEYDYNGTSGGIAVVYYGSPTDIDPNNKLILSKKLADSWFGSSVSGAGDVNGDGYADVLIGAPKYDNGQSDEGVAFLYYGSSSGINAGSSILLDNNLANAYFGASVSGAGDVNRDGYADIVIGAPNYGAGETLEGAIFVYYGSLSGPTNPAIIESNLQNTSLGEDVSSAGDVNGDGYGDIVAGAINYTSGQQAEGAAFIFHGSAQGIISNNPKILQSNQDEASMGTSVSGAGDINGDGYSDIIVGAPGYNKNEPDEGVAIVYYGTGNGISEANPAPFVLEANVPGALFGTAVKSAGDVNGDGYSDVIVGAKSFSNGVDYEGKIYVFHGSPNGVKLTASFSFESDQGNAELGTAVSGAGDVNGDGYSDIIVGAPHANYNQTNDVGAAVVLYGNNGKGLKNNVRLFNGDLVTPLNHNQFSLANFVATLSAKSFIGKNKGKFVWETMGPGVPFSKVGSNPITTSNLFTGASTFTALTGISTTLGGSIAKTPVATKLRVRVRYSPVLALTGQMYGPWRYLQSQLAGYNNAPVPEDAMAETIRRKTTAIDNENAGLSIITYPNPVSDRLYIRTEKADQIRSVRLLTPDGKLSYQSQSGATEVDVRNLAPGMYVLQVTRRDGTQSSHKVVVKK
ncbi:MAG: FG-GAP repeat protein [Dyadobacter sp.]|uniref:FG-GAP-like repeat-containing protein n=1 Tax=Dyadobacter sp. TaxID=1914288 RepID=UPI001B07B380|nr:FG-GAP-like repeat-containing protein [Dyadobacter sp.]MBO9616707.1 FG-GAP repeat protein [Dyadobacter sp.]